MAIKKRGHQVGLVTIERGAIAMSDEITQHCLGHFRIEVRMHAEPQHGGGHGDIEQVDPDVHAAESAANVGCLADRLGRELAGNWKLSAEMVAHQALVKALDCCQ